MFGPRHTIESVTKELVDGLEAGTVILRPEEPTEADVERFESMMKTSLARYRRRAVAVLTLSSLAAIASIAIALVPILLRSESQSKLGEPYTEWAVALSFSIVGALFGFVFGFRMRERSIELKTYIRVLKMADSGTARRLVLRVGPKLRERELVP